MASSDSDLLDILNHIVVCLHRYVAPVLYIVGNISNLLSMIVFLRRSWRKNVCVFYFLICLLIDLSYINSTLLASIFILGFDIHVENSSVILCKLFYYISYLLAALLPNVLAFASIDRLLLSSQNVDTRLYSSKRLAYFSISLSTLFWLIFYSHALIKIDILPIYSSVVICYYETSGSYFEFISYSTLIIAVGFSIVLFILSIMASKNVRQLHAASDQRCHQLHSMHKKDFQLLRCLYVHDIIHASLNTFSAIYYAYIAATKNQVRTVAHQKLDYFLQSFAIFNHHFIYCVSFFVFLIVSKAFRREIKRLFFTIGTQNQTSMQEEEHRSQNHEENRRNLNVVDVISTIELPQ